MAVAAEPIVVEIPLAEEVVERYLEIRGVATGRVVTVIELLSPKNKRSGAGRDAYLQKRQRIMMSQTHLVEIDLLRGGVSLPMVGGTKSDYRILISRSIHRPQADLYAFSLRQPIPAIAVPLAGEASVLLDLQLLLHQIYDRARFQLAINYQQVLLPQLSEDDKNWVFTKILH